MPLSPLNPSTSRYFVRRPGGGITGPFDTAALTSMLADGRLNGSEDISTDRQTWRSIRTLIPVQARAASAPKSPLDLDDDDGIRLPPLEIGFAGDGDGDGADEFGGDLGPQIEAADSPAADLGISLELVERKPVARSEPPTADERTAAGRSNTLDRSGIVARTAAGPSHAGIKAPAVRDASAAVAQMLQAEVEQVPVEATQPVRLDAIQPVPPSETRARRRTLTAARGGKDAAGARPRWRPSRRLIVVAAAVALAGTAIALTVALDLPDRLRGEPDRLKVLGRTADDIAQDRFPAFSEGARLLEDAANARRFVSATRAAAAELLASSVVVHGADRGRIAHAEALLSMKDSNGTGPALAARVRAAAWVALAKGRWKDAEGMASDHAVGLSDADRAVLKGWAALGREDVPHALTSFQFAVRADPAPFPSRAAILYALARAREADLSPETADAFRAVLAEAPSHVGAALGLARVSPLPAAARLKLAEAVIAKQAHDASRPELGEAQALVARTARELGLLDKSDVALRRGREADPSGVAAAVLAGDILLAEGRTDEAVSRYRLALAAPVSTPRTPWLKFARVAALVESERAAEAKAALADLDRRLPTDPRVVFWRGRIAERAHPADTVAAERAYREALTREPHFLPAGLQLARLLLDQRRGAEALIVLRRAEKVGTPAVTLRLALGQALLVSGNAGEAIRTFRQAVTADPKNAAARLGLASALENTGDLEGARGELAALIARGEVPGLGTRVATILVKLGRKDEALATYQKEITTGGAPATTKVAAARLALDLGKKDMARTWAEAAVADDPRTPGALLALADVRRAEGDLGSALTDLRRALAVDGSAEVQLEYGRALAALGRDEDALSALTQAREIPESGIERGRILLHRGDVDGAVKELKVATARVVSNADAFLLLGQAEDRLGHAASAEAAWKAAVKLAPRSAESQYRLGRLQMDHGQAAAALPHLRAAAEHMPGSHNGGADATWYPDLFFQLGFAELRQGANGRALTAFKRYLETAPSDAPARVEVTRQVDNLTH